MPGLCLPFFSGKFLHWKYQWFSISLDDYLGGEDVETQSPAENEHLMKYSLLVLSPDENNLLSCVS